MTAQLPKALHGLHHHQKGHPYRVHFVPRDPDLFLSVFLPGNIKTQINDHEYDEIKQFHIKVRPPASVLKYCRVPPSQGLQVTVAWGHGWRAPERAGPHISWSLQPTGLQRIQVISVFKTTKLPTNNAEYTPYSIQINIKANRGGSRQYSRWISQNPDEGPSNTKHLTRLQPVIVWQFGNVCLETKTSS